MKRQTVYLCLLTFLMILTTISSAQTQKNLSGKYVSSFNNQDILLLKEDGKFILRESGLTLKGEWDLHNSKEIRLKWCDFGEPIQTRAKVTISGNNLIDKDGIEWVKESGK